MPLKRELGLLDVFCISSGAMISSGLFVLPGLAFTKAGPALILSYFLAALLVVPAMLAKAELSTAMPKAGGTYFFIERSLGGAFGTFGGMASWFSLSLKSAFALVGMAAFVELIHPSLTPTQMKVIAVGFCLFFTVLNILSVKATGRLQIVLVFGLFAALIFYVLGGVGSVHVVRYSPFSPFGLGSVFATAGLVFVSFGGLTKIASVAEEVKNPGRNIPLGMFAAFILVSLAYIAVVFVTVGLLDRERLAGSLTPISLGAGVIMGTFGVVVMAVAALLAFVSTANAGILSASRSPMAMSRDQLLPGSLQKINSRFGTPHISILLTGAFMVSMILFLSLEDLVKTASTLKLILFMFVNVAVVIMRQAKMPSYRPMFRSPLCPWLQIAGAVAYVFLIVEMGAVPLLITGLFILLALAWYWVYARPKITRQSALVSLVKRITDKELGNGSLATELKNILLERDNIVSDRFDRLVEECPILDLPAPLPAEEMFQLVAKELSPRFGIDEQLLFDRFTQRERESQTVVRPGVAIPHITIEGEKKFDIVLVRCKGGITFPDAPDRVHSAFVLVGSRDERNFHLRALMAVAQVTNEADFDTNWLRARNMTELRHVILLSKRMRERL
jgi:amino acid transporter/mannitol/fructose-specific phosphotransferase system IIA component (Ntr-type)